MKFNLPFLIFLSLALGALLSACAGNAAAGKLEGTDWQLSEMNGKMLPLHIVITLSFKDGQAGGSAACNSYGAGYNQNGVTLSFQEIAATEMYCEGVMEFESEFFTTLDTVKTYALKDNRLSLLDGGGAALLVFNNAQAVFLDGTSWKAVQVGETVVPEGVEVTMTFAAEQVSGTAACNRYFAEFKQLESELTFGEAGATKMFCDGEGIMELETAFLKSLPRVRSLEMKMGNLNLLDEAGAVVMTLKPGEKL